MDPDMYKGELLKAHMIAQLLEAMPLEAMLTAIDRAETMAPFIDPTAYIEKRKAMGEDRQVVDALCVAKGRIAKARAEAGR